MDLSSCSNISANNTSIISNHGYNLRKRSIENYSDNIKRKKIDSSARTRPAVFKCRKKDGKNEPINNKIIRHKMKIISVREKKHETFEECKSNIQINNLPRCLMAKIFKLLSPIDRIKIERVCRRWNFIARSFAWNTMTKLTVDNITTPPVTDFGVNVLQNNRIKSVNNQINLIVCRGGKYIKDINLSYFTFLGYKVCNFLRYTPNCIQLNLSGILLTNSSLSTIGRYLPHLKSAYFRRCFYRTQVERGLSHFFTYCKFLELLDLSDNEHLSGENSFSDLQSSLLHLYISNNFRIGNNAIVGITNCTKLKSLSMDRIDLVSSKQLNQLFDNLHNLEILQYGDCFNMSVTSIEVLSIGKLKNLKHLILYDNAIVTEGLIKAISYNCLQLEKFDMSSSNRRISDLALRHLANLPKLSIINFSGMRLLTDQTLKEIASNGKLKELLLHRCYKISDESITYVLKRCKFLNMLDVSYCINVTDLSLRQLLENLEIRHGKSVPSASDKSDKDKFCFWTKRSGITTPFPSQLKSPWLKMMNEMDYEFVLMNHLLHHVNNIGPLPMMFDF